MRITRRDLPEGIAEAYGAQLKEFSEAPSTAVARLFVESAEPARSINASEMEAKLRSAKSIVQDLLTPSKTEFAGVLAIVVLDVTALFGIFLCLAYVGGSAALSVLVMAAAVTAVFVEWCRREEKRRRYHSDVLRAILPLLAKTPVEVMYIAALLRLVEQDNLLGDSGARGLLAQMNALLKSSSEIGQQQEGIRGAISNENLAEIEAMRDDLAARVEQSKDKEARETLRQTLLLCESRRERAIALAPLKERLEAQQEMIRQTLASVGESLARSADRTASRARATNGNAARIAGTDSASNSVYRGRQCRKSWRCGRFESPNRKK